MRKIKRFKVSPDDSIGLAMSVVNKGAVESDFIALAEQKMEKFVGVEGERRMIYGCALRPNFPIYRNNGDEEYYLEFDKEAVDKISKNYFKMGFQSSWTEAHKDEVEGLTITESWLKESMTLDKSIALGLDPELPLGTWFIGCHCENDDIWNAVKEGQYHGFSIEAIVGLEEFESQITNVENNINTMTNDEMFGKIKEMFKEVLASVSLTKQEEKVELEEQAPTEPTVETPTEQQPTEEPTVETPAEPQPQEAPKSEEVVEEPKSQEAPKDNHLEELVNSLKEEIEALKKLNSGLDKKVKELSKQPSAQPVNVNAKPSAADTYASWRETMGKMLGH